MRQYLNVSQSVVHVDVCSAVEVLFLETISAFAKEEFSIITIHVCFMGAKLMDAYSGTFWTYYLMTYDSLLNKQCVKRPCIFS